MKRAIQIAISSILGIAMAAVTPASAASFNDSRVGAGNQSAHYRSVARHGDDGYRRDDDTYRRVDDDRYRNYYDRDAYRGYGDYREGYYDRDDHAGRSAAIIVGSTAAGAAIGAAAGNGRGAAVGAFIGAVGGVIADQAVRHRDRY
ncbi:MAG: hypothetical protein JOZ62_13290 [Acidobacteriaceae bacterium]|nr:hypothetical protein [Acidobacteriaceae bacterium]